MSALAGLRFRAAGPGDADAIAGLHADSWRRHGSTASDGAEICVAGPVETPSGPPLAAACG